MKSLVEAALKTFGKINILVSFLSLLFLLTIKKILSIQVNNVGIFLGNDNIENIEMKNYDEIMHVNLRSAIELTHLCVEHLIKEKGEYKYLS